MPRDQPLADVSRLRRAAERCIVLLGTGLLQHPDNSELRARLLDGRTSDRQFYQSLQLRLLQVVAWNLGERLGTIPGGEAFAKTQYLSHYSSHQLCRLPEANGRTTGDRFSRRLERVLLALWQGDEAIALAPWGSALFDPVGVKDIAHTELLDEQIAQLLSTVTREILDSPDSACESSRFDVQTLGRIHEWLLELRLRVDRSNWSVFLETVPGHERRATGSYFTPPDLVENLLDLTLEPILDERIVGRSPRDAKAAILQLKVVDPACGTGVFLLAAARRIARRLDALQAGGLNTQGGTVSAALTEVISHCLYGVDIGNTAVHLCRLALWFAGGPPHQPRPELREHVQCGNSIFGAWPELMREGIPDIAFEPSEADDPELARLLKQRNRRERSLHVGKRPNSGKSKGQSETLANLWCAAFVWPMRTGSSVPTQQSYAAIASAEQALPREFEHQLAALLREHRFFHWNLRFPEVFGEPCATDPVAPGKPFGFDLVLGNPPWVAHAGRSTQHLPRGQKHFMRHCYAAFRGYPTTHGVFVEMATRILGKGGRIGLVIPASVADLDGYSPTRAAHDEKCALCCPLPDYGEGRFAGVTQPCIALVSRRTNTGRPSADRGRPWQLNRTDLDETGAILLAKWERLISLPPEVFGERGFQSTPELRRHIRKCARPEGPFTLALREGTDVREFQLGEPRFYADESALGGALRPIAEFARVQVVVRQTARYPIAARSDGLAFRNSLLAVLPHESWPWPLLLCLLNSSLFRWCHYHRYRDGRQPILPQMKVGHLRSLPAPPVLEAPLLSKLEKLGAELASRNRGIQERKRKLLDEYVGGLYALEPQEQAMVTSWHATRPR